MSKRKSNSRAFWLILSLVLVLAAVVGVVGYLTNWFQSDLASFYVEYEGQTIVRDCTGLKVESGQKFKVSTVADEPLDYEIKIYASGTEETDFSFKVGGEEYSWYNDVVANDWEFTDYFGIERNGNEFILQTSGFSTVLKKRFPGKEISWTGALPEEVFRIEITVGKTTMNLGFMPYAAVTGVELPDELVLG